MRILIACNMLNDTSRHDVRSMPQSKVCLPSFLKTCVLWPADQVLACFFAASSSKTASHLVSSSNTHLSAAPDRVTRDALLAESNALGAEGFASLDLRQAAIVRSQNELQTWPLLVNSTTSQILASALTRKHDTCVYGLVHHWQLRSTQHCICIDCMHNKSKRAATSSILPSLVQQCILLCC